MKSSLDARRGHFLQVAFVFDFGPGTSSASHKRAREYDSEDEHHLVGNDDLSEEEDPHIAAV